VLSRVLACPKAVLKPPQSKRWRDRHATLKLAKRLGVRRVHPTPYTDLGGRMRQLLGNPNGIEARSPGLPRSGYPGFSFNQQTQPQRGCGHSVVAIHSRSLATTALRLGYS